MSKKIIQLEVDRVVTNAGTQVRAKHNQDAIGEYSTVTDKLPPIKVFWDGKEYILADGFHTLLANLEAGNATLAAEVMEGTRRDAVLFALAANADGRGVRLNLEDRTKGVAILLSDPEWAQWSDKELARRFPHLGTDRTFSNYRIQLSAEGEPEEKDERAACKKCGRRYALTALGRLCDDDNCGGKIKKAKKAKLSPIAAKRKRTTRSVSGGRGSKKRRVLVKATSQKQLDADAAQADDDAAAFREEQLECLDRLEPIVEEFSPLTKRLLLKRTHGILERAKLTIQSDRKRLM